MTTVFVDVDDTLVLYKGGSTHPYGVINGEAYEPNTDLIERLKNFTGRIIVWSGGGKDYARQVARLLLLPEGIRCQAGSKFEDFNQIKPGDIVVDDQSEYYIGMRELGVRIYGPRDDWSDEKPTCPQHPKGNVMRASLANTYRSVWVCLVCGKRLGDAGPRQEPIRESFSISKDEEGLT